MKMKKKKNLKTVLIILGIFVLISLFINFNFTYTGVIKSESLENTTNPPLYTSNSIQYQLEWYRLWGDTHTQEGFSLAIDSNDNIYQAAYTSNGPYGNNDAILIKSTNVGTQIWNRTWGESGNDGAFAVAVDSSNNIYLTGSKDAPNDIIFLVKYDELGNQIWNRTWNVVSDVQSRGITVDSQDDIYIVGHGGSGSDNMVLIKYNNSGAVVWERTWGGANNDQGYDIRVDSQDNVYVAGLTWSFAVGPYDMFLVKYNSLGTQLWNRTWGGIDNDGAYSITIDSDDNIYIGGYTQSYGTIGVSNIALLKYDGSGNLIWNSTYIKGICRRLDVDSYGNIIILGFTGTGLDSHFYVGIYDSFGQLTWNTTWASPDGSINEAWGVGLDSFDNIYISGYTDYYEGNSQMIVLLKYSKPIDTGPFIILNSPTYNEIFGDMTPEFNITVKHYYPLNSTWYTIDGGLTNYTSFGSTKEWINGDYYFTEINGYIDQGAWNAAPTDLILLKFYSKDTFGNIGSENSTIIKQIIRLLNVEIVYHSYSTNEFNFIFFIHNETGAGIDFAVIQMWWDGTDVSSSVLNLGGGSYLVSLDPITISPTEDPILLNMTISASEYEDKYYDAYFAVDPEVIDKTIPEGEPAIPGYSLIYLFGVISLFSVILIRNKFKK